MTRWKPIIRRAVMSGSSASVLSTAALMLCGQRDCGSVFAPVNAVSHWLWKDRAIRQDRPSLRYTLAGYGIHHAMSILWAITYESVVNRHRERARGVPMHEASPSAKHEADPAASLPPERSQSNGSEVSADPVDDGRPDESGQDRQLGSVGLPLLPVLATAAAVAAGACLVDLRCTPPRLTPGFERRLTPSSLFLVYASFGLGLALCDGIAARRR